VLAHRAQPTARHAALAAPASEASEAGLVSSPSTCHTSLLSKRPLSKQHLCNPCSHCESVTVTESVTRCDVVDRHMACRACACACACACASQVYRSVHLGQSVLLLNGAAAIPAKPSCGYVPLSLQIKYSDCQAAEAATSPQPMLQLTRADYSNASICNVTNSQGFTNSSSSGAAVLWPAPADSLCATYNGLIQGVRYLVGLAAPLPAGIVSNVSCYDMSDPAAPVDITNGDGSSFTTKRLPVSIAW
jgi:hypothetical protein